jgi:hypothetical protein
MPNLPPSRGRGFGSASTALNGRFHASGDSNITDQEAGDGSSGYCKPFFTDDWLQPERTVAVFLHTKSVVRLFMSIPVTGWGRAFIYVNTGDWMGCSIFT